MTFTLSDTQKTVVMPLLQEKYIRGRGYVTVSAKGLVNGLSNPASTSQVRLYPWQEA